MFQGARHCLWINLAQSNSFFCSEKCQSPVCISTCSAVKCNRFFETLGRSAILLIPQRSTALKWSVLCSWVFILKMSTALEWLDLCLTHCVLDVGATLSCRFLQTWWCSSLARRYPSLIWFLLANLEQFLLFCGHSPRSRLYACFVFFLYYDRVWLKLLTMKWFRVVWLCPSLCRDHTIRCTWRVWH